MESPLLDRYFEFLRFQSVSTDSQYQPHMTACAEWLQRQFQAMNFECAIHPTPGHPVVLARSPRQEGKPTVLIYGHYDVQPVDPVALWTNPPFEPTLLDGKVYARGSTDNKGQILAHILGTEALLARDGELPVNLIYLVEGEEEIGSPHLAPFLQQHRAELQCDVVAVSDTGMVAPGYPTFTYGLRGIAALEFDLVGPKSDLHSGIYGGAVVNPATVAARLVASLHDDDWRVRIPGFYDAVIPTQDWEEATWSKLPDAEQSMLSVSGAPGLGGEAGQSHYARVWARPTAECNGIGGGYQGEGTKTVLPSKAHVKLSFRLVPDQNPSAIVDRAIAYLEAQIPPQITATFRRGHVGMPYLLDPQLPVARAAVRALEKAWDHEVALIREGGSIPIVQTFKEMLGVETLLLGLALPDCGAHAPDENFPIANFEGGIRMHQALMRELGEALSEQ